MKLFLNSKETWDEKKTVATLKAKVKAPKSLTHGAN